jgi:hypothetical protein
LVDDAWLSAEERAILFDDKRPSVARAMEALATAEAERKGWEREAVKAMDERDAAEARIKEWEAAERIWQERFDHVAEQKKRALASCDRLKARIKELEGERDEAIRQRVRGMCADIATDRDRWQALGEAARELFPPDAGMWDSPRMAPLVAALARLEEL